MSDASDAGAASAAGRRIEPFRDARSTRPRSMRLLNGLGRFAPGWARPSAEAWLAEARKAIPGAPAPEPGVVEALDALVHSLNAETRLNLVGRFSAKGDTVRMLKNHFRIESLLQRSPEMLETKLPPPIFIVGMPRTGTTFLHQLMAADPRSRSIPYWESFDPIPPSEGPDRRAAAVDRMLGQLGGIAPDYQAIHPMTAEGPEECVALFMNLLRTLQFDIQYKAPSYVRWLLDQDADHAYREYSKQLRIIQFYRSTGDRFLLKDPTHLVHLESLLRIFPDARILFTHRDPAQSLSSICSLYAYTRAIFSDEVDPNEIGAEILDGYWPRAQESAMRIRERLDPQRFCDVRQADLARDPIETVRRIYSKWDLEWDDIVRDRLEAFLSEARAAGRNQHLHSPEGFGQSGEAMRERLSGYVAAFDL